MMWSDSPSPIDHCTHESIDMNSGTESQFTPASLSREKFSAGNSMEYKITLRAENNELLVELAL